MRAPGSVHGSGSTRRGEAGRQLQPTGRTCREPVGLPAGGRVTELPEPPLHLGEPGTIRFTASRAYQGQEINRFALSLRSEANRERFLAAPRPYAQAHGLGEEEIELIEGRDWTGLLLAGAHVQALLKLAATVGSDLWDIGAHNVGTERAELLAACPRRVRAVPGSV